jgi:hypothetical protein
LIEARKVRVALGDTPQQDRYVSLTSARILATDVFVVAVVDGTGRLADHTTLLTTPIHERARRHANRLVQALGKVEQQEHYINHLPADVARRPGYGLPRRPRPAARRRFVYIEDPQRQPNGSWLVAWLVVGADRESGKRFKSEREARKFHQQLIQQREENNR